MSDLLQKRTKRRRRMTRGAIIAAVLLAGFFVVSNMLRPDPAPQYRTASVQRGDIESAIVALGSVDAKNYVDVGAQVSGQLLTLHFEIGEEVQRGDLVAEIDPELAQSRVDASRAQLRELEASKLQQVAQLRLAEARAARARALLGADAISLAESEAIEADLEVAEARIVQLDAQIARTQSTLDGDLTSLGYTKIYAPMTGTVVSHAAVVGQTLNAAQTAPAIMRIADLSLMTVSADVSEADVPRLREGMRAYFTTLGNPDRRWTATVRQVLPEPEVVSDVVLYKALLDVPNDDRTLLPRMSTQVSFVLGQARDVLKIPAAALQIPDSMMAAAGAMPGGRANGEQGVAGMPADMRERFANMPESERAEMRQRFQQGGGQAGTRGGNGQGGPAFAQGSGSMDDSPFATDALPNWMSDGSVRRTQMLLVQTPNGPEAREVVVGLVSRTEAEIVSGLELGEEIILGMAAAGQAAAAGGGGFGGPPGMMFR